jgi:hypothetical protein
MPTSIRVRTRQLRRRAKSFTSTRRVDRSMGLKKRREYLRTEIVGLNHARASLSSVSGTGCAAVVWQARVGPSRPAEPRTICWEGNARLWAAIAGGASWRELLRAFRNLMFYGTASDLTVVLHSDLGASRLSHRYQRAGAQRHKAIRSKK